VLIGDVLVAPPAPDSVIHKLKRDILQINNLRMWKGELNGLALLFSSLFSAVLAGFRGGAGSVSAGGDLTGGLSLPIFPAARQPCLPRPKGEKALESSGYL
jgi:hypothetical protein